jgi:predicted branched-subunit amino acid permease
MTERSPTFAREFRRGFLDIAPLLFGVAPFGLLFGTLAAQKGLSPLETILMCATVYAGGAQFVSIDVWATPVPVLAVVAATALANTRYFLMGAALRPHVTGLPPGTRWGFLAIHSDETWALALKRAKGGTDLTPGYVLGLIGVFYVNWPIWAGIGAVFGGVIEDPARFGADFMFSAMFIGLIAGMWRGRASLIVLCASGMAALAAYHLIPGHWYIFIGAVTGMTAGALSHRSEATPS